MEAVPRLPMLGFKMKQAAEPATSFNNLKLYIAELYQEDADSYSKEVYELETLRNVAARPSHDMDGCLKLKRYYCQLNSLLHRFPLLTERPMLTFSWRDAYSSTVIGVSDLQWEMSVILYNIAALHAQLGSEEARTTPESMKLACTHFQCAAGALDMFKERGAPPEMADLASDVIMFMGRVCLAQAQECILEKSLSDNRKPGIVAKVTSQIVNYYNSALAMIIASGEDGLLADTVGSKQFREWKKYLMFKISYLSAVLYLYQGQSAEEAKKFGERVTLSQLAFDKIEEAKREAKGMADQEKVQETLAATLPIIEGKKKMAKNENEFIYHEEVPDISTISAVQGANLVNGIAFSVTDSELLQQDIFHRLVPMKAHEGSSLYSEEKAQILRTIGTKIEDRDAELNGFMSSLNMEFLQFDQSAAIKLPQAIVDRCASLNARSDAIPDLVALMSQLAENCGEVEMQLREIKKIFAEEEVVEKAYQQTMGQRPTVYLNELNREYQKYQEAHNKAGESNETLRKAMGLHVANLRILSKPMTEIQQMVPQMSNGGGHGSGDNPHFAELRKLLNKVTEMRGQRTQLVNSLRDAINADDITTKIVASGENDLEKLFKQELSKHEKTATLIDMNLVAQGNILKALTDCYAKCAPAIKQMSDTKHKRDQFFSALVASYDVYEDLLGKSTKGLEFYKKLHNNVAKLYARVKAARDVQSEERQQRLSSAAKAQAAAAANSASMEKPANSGPKLRDYMKAGGAMGLAMNHPRDYIPSVRPSPLGSENTSVSTCVTSTATDKFNNQTMQYGGVIPGGGQNNYNQQNYMATGGDGNYFQSQQPNATYKSPQMPTGNTGFVNPIYQTGGYVAGQGGVNQQQAPTVGQMHSYNYPTAASSSGAVSGTNSPMATASPASQGMRNVPAAPSGNYQGNPPVSYNSPTYPPNQSTPSQNYTPTSLPAHSNYNSAYSNASPAVNPQNQSGISPQTNAYSTMTGNTQPAATTYYSTVPNPSYSIQSYSTPSTTYSYAPASQSTVASPASGITSVAASTGQAYSNQSQQQQQITAAAGNVNSYSTSGNTAPSSTNIPQVAQQMGQMNIATSQGAGYAGYYPGTSTAYSVGSNQTYYGQSGQSSNAPNYLQSQQQSTSGTYGQAQPSVSTGGQYSQQQQQQPGGSVAGNQQQLAQSQYGTNQGTGPGVGTTAGNYGQNNQYNTSAGWQPPGTNYQQQQHPSGYSNAYQGAPGSGVGQGNAQQNMAGQYSTTGYPAPGGVQQGYNQNYNVSSNTPQPTVSQANQPVYPGQNLQQPSQPATNVAAIPQQPPPAVPPPTTAPASVPKPAPAPPVVVAPVNSRNMDLLSGIDFAGPTVTLPEPMLQPKPASSAPSSVVDAGKGEKKEEEKVGKSIIDDDVVSVLMDDSKPPPSLANMDHIKSFLMSAQQPQSPSPSLSAGGGQMDRKMSMDNISICSEISSIDQNFDWESVSVRNDGGGGASEQNEAILSKFKGDGGVDDPKAIKYFHSEVERLEKFLEGVNIKTLNGSTPLDKKWQELQNLLVKDEGKRTATVAKLFPEKNRAPDCIPFDHARVQLPTATDDYVNASYVKDLGAGCPPLILAQTPMQNTNKDFWHMVWAQKSKLVVCLHTQNEMMHPFWPTRVNEELTFDDFSIVLLKQFDLTNCVEYSLKLTMLGCDAVQELSALKLKTWAQNVPSQVVGVARDAITSYKQRMLTESGGGAIAGAAPIVINCLTGSRRSPLVAVAITAVLATKSKRPLLINVVDAWYRIATQRRGVLENERELEQSFQVVLSNAHDLLNKHGIMTPFQVKNAQKAAIIEKEQAKDPLSDLDPLWKLKK